jgi:hypothetical protein
MAQANGKDVKTHAFVTRMQGQPGRTGINHMLQFGFADFIFRVTEVERAPRFHFHEMQVGCTVCDDVNFEMSVPPVPVNNLKITIPQPTKRFFFSRSSGFLVPGHKIYYLRN